jgi:hypothetical protein
MMTSKDYLRYLGAQGALPTPTDPWWEYRHEPESKRNIIRAATLKAELFGKISM